jgi:ABC-type branched-subunit amino acid transport system substrate-binding protein
MALLGTACGSSDSSSTSGGSSSEVRKASDTGITADTITIGLVGPTSGNTAPIFKVAIDAIDTFVQDTNAAGGINGRKLVLKIQDDAGDPQKFGAAVRDLADQVFAFVGSISIADSGGVQLITRNKIPDLGTAQTPDRRTEPTYAHLGSTIVGGHKAVANYAKSVGVTRMAYVTFNSPEANNRIDAEEGVFKAAGIPTCYREHANFTDPDYTSYVVAMQQQNCDGVIVLLAQNAAAKFQIGYNRQKFAPKLELYSSSVYSQSFISLSGGATVAEGAATFLTNAPVEDSGQEMQHYVSALKQYHPDDDPRTLNALSNWADALTFAKALQDAGANPTRATFMDALGRINNFTAGGLVPPANPLGTGKNFVPCVVIVQLKGGQWKRVQPSSGFDCTT